MPLQIDVKFHGGEEAMAFLTTLNPVQMAKAFRGIVRASATVVRDTAIRFAPVGKGYLFGSMARVITGKGAMLTHHAGSLKNSISISFRKVQGQEPGATIAHVRTRPGHKWVPNAAYYSHMVEFGTRGPRGMAPRPFLAPAAKASKGQAYMAGVMKARKEWIIHLRKNGTLTKRARVTFVGMAA